jgi:Ni,Fe-hydrogenase III large subunit
LNWTEIKNLQCVPLKEIPKISFDVLSEQLIREVKSGKRLVQFFGDEEPGGVVLYVIIADDVFSKLFITSTKFSNEKKYLSLSNVIPSAHMFEREFYEQFGIEPEAHPWLKPVRKGIAGIDNSETQYQFFSMSGEEVHEVGVGPIHAGIIEPGHFRFSCHGEKIYNLEIELGFQHRGVEKLFLQNKNRLTFLIKLAESIAGDSVIAHASTFAQAYESLADINVSRRVKLIRAIALELERIAIHLGDLSALAGDVAYLTGNAVFGALRTKVINTTMVICGNRLGRGLLTLGGVNFDIPDDLRDKVLETVNQLDEEISVAAEVFFSAASVLERFERTGIVDENTAREIGMVGPAARASGVSVDTRSDHPFGAYEFFPHHKLTLNSGDVFARAYIRFIEIQQSIRIIIEQLNNLSEGELRKDIQHLQPSRLVVSLTEGWRGEVAHVLITDDNGQIKKVKIKDPSFNNWFALALAVRNNGISDFPVCNKSFNLSYCGFDL